jgi:DNA-binding NtrC family response regulator
VIFIIESDRDCRLALAELLGLQGYAVLNADNAVDALKMLARGESESTVILIDPLKQPRSLLGFLKQRAHPESVVPRSIDLPEIAEVSEEATIVGSLNYLRKPINPGNLLRVLARLRDKRSD